MYNIRVLFILDLYSPEGGHTEPEGSPAHYACICIWVLAILCGSDPLCWPSLKTVINPVKYLSLWLNGPLLLWSHLNGFNAEANQILYC